MPQPQSRRERAYQRPRAGNCGRRRGLRTRRVAGARLGAEETRYQPGRHDPNQPTGSECAPLTLPVRHATRSRQRPRVSRSAIGPIDAPGTRGPLGHEPCTKRHVAIPPPTLRVTILWATAWVDRRANAMAALPIVEG